jgi:hypothetical protein
LKNFQKVGKRRWHAFILKSSTIVFGITKLGRECPCTDIDFVEYKIVNNKPEIVALIEVKTPFSSMQRAGISW